MAYLTVTSILEELPRLPQTTTAQGYTTTSSLISAHITKAEDQINGTLGVRYAVPFATVPPLVRTIAIDLVAYRTIRSKYGSDNRNRNDYLDDYHSALDTLQKIADGKLVLADTSGALIAERGSGSKIYSSTEGHQQIFDMDTVTSWKVDSDYLTTLESGRL